MLFLPTHSYGDMGDFARTYLGELERKETPVFFSRCISQSNFQYSAALLFEVGSTNGFLIEQKNKIVVNLATVRINKSELLIDETHGGVYSYERVKKLVKELAGYRFRLLMHFTVIKMEGTSPINICSSD
jgi:hypothetical protein